MLGETNIAKHRLSVLEIAERLGNVIEAATGEA
jgi:hypothetical protein